MAVKQPGVMISENDRSDICKHAEIMGRMKYPVETRLGRIVLKMGRIISDIRPLF